MAGPKFIVGLDLGAHSVKACKIDAQSGALISFDVFPIPARIDPVEEETTEVRPAPTEDATTEIAPPTHRPPVTEGWMEVIGAYLASDDDIAKSKIVTNAPDEVVAALHIDVPFSDRTKVESVIPHLLADELPFDVRKAVYDFYAYDKPRSEGAEAAVAFSRQEDIEAFLEQTNLNGFDPAVLGAPALTLGLYASTLFKDSPDALAIVDIGHEFSNLVVIDRGRPIVARNNRAAGRKITEKLAERFNVPFAEAEQIKHQYAAIVEGDASNEQMAVMSETIVNGLRPVVRDVRRTLQGLFAQDGTEVSVVYVTGGTSQVKNIEKFMSHELGIPVRRLSVDGAGQQEPIAAMATALARNVEDERHRSRMIDLRQGSLAYSGSGSPIRRNMIRFAVVMLAVLMVVGGIFYLERLGHEARRDAMKKELGVVSNKVFGEKTMSASDVRKKFAGDSTDAEAFVPKMSAYELMHEVVKNINKDTDLELTRIEVDITRNVIQIVGKTSDAQAVDRVVSDLREIECFKKVTPGKTKVKDDKAEFDVQISSGCS